MFAAFVRRIIGIAYIASIICAIVTVAPFCCIPTTPDRLYSHDPGWGYIWMIAAPFFAVHILGFLFTGKSANPERILSWCFATQSTTNARTTP